MYFPTAKCALLPGTAFPAAAQEQVVGSSTEHRCPSLLLVQSSGPGQVVWHWGGEDSVLPGGQSWDHPVGNGCSLLASSQGMTRSQERKLSIKNWLPILLS